MRSPLGAALLAVCIAPAMARAQQYDVRTFSLEQGLPGAGVNDICEDLDGFLWVATEDGVARGQGSTFETFDQRHGATGLEATALFASRTKEGENLLWTGFRNGTLAAWSNGSFTPLKTNTPLPPHPVRTILGGPANTLWLATRGGGICSVDTVTHEVKAFNDGVPTLRINALATFGGKGLLAATDSGLIVLQEGRWTEVEAGSTLRGKRVLSLFTDSLGVLVGTSAGYVELGTDLSPLPIAQRAAGYQPLVLPHEVVLSVWRVDAGDIWLGTPGGLVHIHRPAGVPELVGIREANGLGHDLVRCLHRDRSGGIWAGTGYGGVTKYTSDAFRYFTERDGLGSRIVSAVHRSADGLLWFATQGGGVARFDGHHIQRFGREHGLPSLFITCLGEDGEGHLLAGTAVHGLHRFDNERFTPVWTSTDRDAARINDLGLTADGRVLIGTGAGLFMLEKGGVAAAGLDHGAVRSICVHGDQVWCGTDSGMFHGRPGAEAAFERMKEVPAVGINSVVRDSKGSLWMGTTGQGLLRWDGRRMETYGRGSGLESPVVELVLLDAFENLWLGTRHGVHQVELDALQEQVLGIRCYLPEDGFTGLESLRGSGLLDGDSSLWFGTVRGAIRYDQRRVVEDPLEPVVHLTEIQLFYERPDWTPWCHGMDHDGMPSELHLPYDKNHLTFAFTGISLAYPEKVRYRWMLEGYDPDWSPITATQRITYSNIPPGEYTFKVMARNASGVWNQEPVSYTFAIAPPFWQTNSFRLGGGVLLVLCVIGTIRVRTHRLRKDRERLERMVTIRTSELAEEKERSEQLLLNILPASTAEELKRKGSAEAQRYESCTVLFSDFKGFTSFSSLMDSDTLVRELDHYFRLFDELCDRHGLEKIKTIGDAYMCAAGLPEPTPTHARDAVLMGLDMLRVVERSNAERRTRGLTEWPVRIGIHTGPVVAGVVGRKKFAYDIWGDTVNLASRMENHGEAGRVNISGTTFARVMDLVHAQPRGPIRVKGRGELQMYFVTGLKDGLG